MAMNGVQMMLKSLGLDPEKIMGDFDQLMKLVKGEQEKINAKLDTQAAELRGLKEQLERMETRQAEIWNMNRTALSMASQVRQVPQSPQPPAQAELVPPPLEQSRPPQPQL